MFCTHCHMTRPYDWNACPHCGTPSPLYDGSQVGGTEQAAGQARQWPWEIQGQNVQPGQAAPGEALELSMITGPHQMAQPDQDQDTMMHAPQNHRPLERIAPAEASPISMLPVPYQQSQQGMVPHFQFPGTGLQSAQEDITVHIPQNREQMLPALPQQGDKDAIVYVPPMYTKPRPIIPRYRIISGLLSVLIVTILTCTGAGYYAKATGKLQAIQRVVGGAAPASLSPTAAPNLPDPQAQPVTGPAYVVITSAVMTAHTDPTNPYFAKEPENKFVVNHLIHLIYSVQKPSKAGIVKTVWYTNGHYYGEVLSKTVPAGAMQTGDSQVKYMQPCEGKVELYWNNQLAWTLFFVVRPQ